MTDLLTELEKLRVILSEAGIERTVGLRDLMGDDCFHYKRSLNLFLDKGFSPVKDQLLKVIEEMRKVEGKDFGR